MDNLNNCTSTIEKMTNMADLKVLKSNIDDKIMALTTDAVPTDADNVVPTDADNVVPTDNVVPHTENGDSGNGAPASYGGRRRARRSRKARKAGRKSRRGSRRR